MKKFIWLIIFLYAIINVYGQATGLPVCNGIEFSPRLLDNLLFLNNFDKELPIEKQMLYKWAETALVREPDKSFAVLANYKDFQKHCEKNDIVHLGGPMLGNISSSSVDVWVRTVKPEKVEIIVSKGKIKQVYGPVYSTLGSNLSVVIHINGLNPNEKYPYKVLVNNKKLDLPFETIIQTAPEELIDKTRIAFGSCFHRWGLGNTKQAKTIIDRNPNGMLLLGDIAAQDKLNHIGWHSLDYLARDLYPAWQNLTSKVPVYATWDDHDYFGNDLWGIPEGYTDDDRNKVWNVFKNSWVNPSYGFGQEEKGVFLRTRIGVADIIMLDNRFFRTKNSFLGEKQLEWFKKQLLDCKGPFIILSCGSMWSDYVSGGKDSWGTFDPKAREEIFELIEKNNISGVLLISGDRHGARGFMIPRQSGFHFYEFEAGSLGGIIGPAKSKPEWTTQLYGMVGEYAFGEFTFDTSQSDPSVTFRLINENSEILYEKEIPRSELTPANFY